MTPTFHIFDHRLDPPIGCDFVANGNAHCAKKYRRVIEPPPPRGEIRDLAFELYSLLEAKREPDGPRLGHEGARQFARNKGLEQDGLLLMLAPKNDWSCF